MSLTITVRKAAETTGGVEQKLPDAGDNGNQEIDTKAEAEGALGFVTGDDMVAVAGGKTYTRADLIKIRDANAGATTPEAAPKDAGKVAAPGVSHGFFLEGNYIAGLGDQGHSGLGGSVGYTPGITLMNGTGLRLHLDPRAGFTFGHVSAEYKTPGGEKVQSGATYYGGLLGAALRIVPSILDHRLSFSPGFSVRLAAFGTADSEQVSLPASCTPGDFGRGECEPNAGPRSGNAGTKGLMNFESGSARGTSGALISLGFPLTIGFDIMKGNWGNMRANAGVEIARMMFLPSDGHTTSFWSVLPSLGISGNFGGGAVEKAPVDNTPIKPPSDKDNDGVPDSEDKCVDVAGTKENGGCPADKDKDGVSDIEDKCPDVAGIKENAGCPAFDAKVTSAPTAVKADDKFLVGLSTNTATRARISFKDAEGTLSNSNSAVIDEGNSKSEFKVPAGLKSGKYKLVITFEDMATHVKKTEEKEIVIVENVTASLPPSFGPGQPPAIQDVKVAGMDKLEGVTYVLEGFDKDGKSVGTAASKTPVTLNEKTGQLIKFEAPTKKGFEKDVTYKVTLKNKEGHEVWAGSFVVGQAAVGQRKRGAK